MSALALSGWFVLAALAILLAGLWRSGCARRLARAWWAPVVIAFVALSLLTIVFDSLMIAARLFDYGADLLSGVRLWLAPVEDLAYPLAALIALPGVWLLLTPRREHARGAGGTPPSRRPDAP